MSNKLQDYSNKCAEYGDIMIRISQLEELLEELGYKAQTLKDELKELRSSIKQDDK